jgi:hypothetical protein
MNLQKYTKAELISKFKKIESKNENKQISILNQFNSYFSQIWNLILTFKNILVKLTLISFFIQIFKKYRIFRKIWRILNTIIVTIFGISLIDNFGLDFISNFFKEIKFIIGNIVDYLTNTQFYLYLNKLFSNKELNEVPTSEQINKNESFPDIKRKEKGNGENFGQSDRNSKISEWLKSESKTEIKESSEELSKDSSYKKYFIITGITIVIASLGWYYSDEIIANTHSIIEWIRSFRPGTPDQGGNNPNDSGTVTPTNIQESINTSPDIELIDKGKSRILTSPSLEDLNSKAKESWGESISPSSPDSVYSSSSSDTITPSNLTPLEIEILNKVEKEWKNLCPIITKNKIEFIENNINRISNLEFKKQIIKYLADIEIDNWDFIKRTKLIKNRITEIELLQMMLIQEHLNKWITKYNNEIFK